MMKPLEQWVCDTCREIIDKEDGWFEWLEGDDMKAHSFRIVHHHQPAAPRGLRGCQYPPGTLDVSDLYLTDFIGSNLPALYRFLDVGSYHDPKGEHLPGVRNLREFMEIVRRLTLPHYEEARLYFGKAAEDGFFDGANEVWIYLPDTLREVIQRYGPIK